jgi:cyclase
MLHWAAAGLGVQLGVPRREEPGQYSGVDIRMSARVNRRQLLQQVGAVALIGVAAQVPAAAPAAAKFTRQGLGAGIDLIGTGSGNSVLVSSGGESALIDGCAAADATAMLRWLRDAAPIAAHVNTNWHPERTGCNDLLGKAGVPIVAHEYTRQWMRRPIQVAWRKVRWPARAQGAWPTRTFIAQDELKVGAVPMKLGYLPQACTDGDIYVHLPEYNLLIAGEAVAVGQYPLSDVATGGWIKGMQEASKRLLALCDERTRIVPAVGAVIGKAQLQAQHDMLEVLTERIWQLLRKGMSDLDIVAAQPTAEYDAQWGEPRQFIVNAYQGIWNHVREMRGIV